MRIIISPAKKLRVGTDSPPYEALPAFHPRTQQLLAALRPPTLELQRPDCQSEHPVAGGHGLTGGSHPAILSYEGIQYQYMAPGVFTAREYRYIQEHLRILSGFYGLLRPFDGVTPYRLEMQAKLTVNEVKNLYTFWGAPWRSICSKKPTVF